MLFFAIKDGNGEFLSGCFLTVIFLSSIPFPVGTFTFLKVKRHQSLKFKPIFLKFSFKHQIKQTLTNFFVKKINTIKKSEGKKRKKLCFFTHSKNYFTQGCRATASSLTEIPKKVMNSCQCNENVSELFLLEYFSEVSYSHHRHEYYEMNFYFKKLLVSDKSCLCFVYLFPSPPSSLLVNFRTLAF